MKKLMMIIMMLGLLAAFAMAENIGFGLDLAIDGASQAQGAQTANRFGITAEPSLILTLAPSLQLEPFLLIGGSTEVDPAAIAPWGDQVNAMNFGVGAGIYLFPAKSDLWSFGCGAKLTLGFNAPAGVVLGDYLNMSVKLEVPLVIELALTKLIHVRISQQVAGLTWALVSAGQGATLNQDGTFTFSTFITGFNPFFGFRFYL